MQDLLELFMAIYHAHVAAAADDGGVGGGSGSGMNEHDRILCTCV